MSWKDCDYYSEEQDDGKVVKITDCTDYDLETVPKDIFETNAKAM